MARRHGAATFLTELSMLRRHAGGDFWYVRYELGTQPHGVGRAGLAYIDGLGARPGNATAKCADRQRQPANQMYASH